MWLKPCILSRVKISRDLQLHIISRICSPTWLVRIKCSLEWTDKARYLLFHWSIHLYPVNLPIHPINLYLVIPPRSGWISVWICTTRSSHIRSSEITAFGFQRQQYRKVTAPKGSSENAADIATPPTVPISIEELIFSSCHWLPWRMIASDVSPGSRHIRW